MDEQQIRERAHLIWEREGRPRGREQEHWQMARQQLAIEENAGAASRPTSNATDQRPGPRAEPFEVEVEDPDNEGSVPDLRGAGPYPKHRRKAH